MIAWHSFACDPPEGWEVTGYRTAAAAGEFRLHERLDERCRLAWVVMAIAPDLERMQGELRLRQGEELGGWRTRTVGRFVLGHGAAGRPAQAVAFLERDRRLIHISFPAWDEAACARTWIPFLESFRLEGGDHRRWCLFDLPLRLPTAYQVRVEEAQPANALLVGEAAGHWTLRAQRLGLARHHLARRDPERLLRSLLLPEEVRVTGVEELRFAGVPAVRATYTATPPRVRDRLRFRRWQGEAILWHLADANRIHVLDQRGDPRHARLDLGHVAA